MSQIIPIEQQIPAFALPEDQLIKTLGASLYPGANIDSIKLVLGYCRAQRLDPMQKPVHIVPMKVKVGTKDNGKALYADRDTIMPGIGLYRSQASRSGAHAGTSEPEFGPPVEFRFVEEYWEDDARGNGTKKKREKTITHPEWCKVTVKRRLPDGEIASFTAMEFWSENYATASRYTDAPNAMWQKRPFAQLVKCAEAQALRRAFPEFGAAPTAEEMEGKPFEIDEPGSSAPPERPGNEFMPAAKPKSDPPSGAMDVDPETGEVKQTTAGAPETGASPATSGVPPVGEVASAGMIATVRKTMERKGKTEEAFVEKFGVKLDAMPNAIRNEAMAWARA